MLEILSHPRTFVFKFIDMYNYGMNNSVGSVGRVSRNLSTVHWPTTSREKMAKHKTCLKCWLKKYLNFLAIFNLWFELIKMNTRIINNSIAHVPMIGSNTKIFIIPITNLFI